MLVVGRASTPCLVVKGEVVVFGGLPKKDEIIAWMKQAWPSKAVSV